MVPALLVIVAMLYGIRTIRRNRDWSDNETLFRQVLATQEDATLIHASMGTVLSDRGDFVNAEKEWFQALETTPNNIFALTSLGLMKIREQQYDEALDYFNQYAPNPLLQSGT